MQYASNCDTSIMFTGGGPPDVGAYVFIGDTQLIPAPFVSLSLEKYRAGEKIIGGALKLTLRGMALGDSFNEVVTGQGDGMGIRKVLRLGQIKNCVCVTVQCAEALVTGYGKILSVNIDEGNQPSFVNMAPYIIEIELYTNSTLVAPTGDGEQPVSSAYDFSASANLKNISESFSWSINDETFDWGTIKCTPPPDYFGNRHIKVNFNISASGVDLDIENCLCEASIATIPPPTGIYGLRAAENYLTERLTDLVTGTNNSLFNFFAPPFAGAAISDNAPDTEITGAFYDYIGGPAYMDFRTINIDPTTNTIDLSGEIIYRPSGCGDAAFSTLNIEHTITTEDESVIISGNITGLSNHTYDKIIKLTNGDFQDCTLNTKMSNAESFFTTKIYNGNLSDFLTAIADCYAGKSPYPDGYIKDSCASSTLDEEDCMITPTPATFVCPSLRVTNAQISRNLSAGEINFSFTLSNAPNCDVPGVVRLDIDITHDKPHDNIVEIIIPGRGSKGVLVQNLCCDSAEKYDINVDASLANKSCNPTIKKTTIDKVRECVNQKLLDMINDQEIDISCWFKTNDTETLGKSTYKLSRTYVKPSCP